MNSLPIQPQHAKTRYASARLPAPSMFMRHLLVWFLLGSSLLFSLAACCHPFLQPVAAADLAAPKQTATASLTRGRSGSPAPTSTPPTSTLSSKVTPTSPKPNKGTAEATPTPAATTANSAPAPAPIGTVVYYEESVTLPTYPYERYQTDVRDLTYNWPYKKFDIERFRAEAPKPINRQYRVIVLENSYLKVLILPEVGGRIWQVIHKPSKTFMFYQNSVVKPTHWGNVNQLGWLALGGLEWNLPVIEHGYDWGSPWGFIPLQQSEDLATVTVFTPQDGRYLNASITISLRAGAAAFEIEPTITNVSNHELAFSYWQDALLAPGSGKQPSAQLHFVLPTDRMTIHSTFDKTLPMAGQPFAWPIYDKRDLSFLGNWQQYMGFFEVPAAHGPFTGVYDGASDSGAVRVYPADVMRGSKVFALGWGDRLGSDNFTDDTSFYVELHGGLATTFDTQYHLPTNGSVNWREVWYPVHGIHDLTFANEVAALAVQPTLRGLRIGLYPTRPLDGTLIVAVAGKEVARKAVQARPDAPFNNLLTSAPLPAGQLSIQFQDAAGRVLLTYPTK